MGRELQFHEEGTVGVSTLFCIFVATNEELRILMWSHPHGNTGKLTPTNLQNLYEKTQYIPLSVHP